MRRHKDRKSGLRERIKGVLQFWRREEALEIFEFGLLEFFKENQAKNVRI
jgi:hypothetical protein